MRKPEQGRGECVSGGRHLPRTQLRPDLEFRNALPIRRDCLALRRDALTLHLKLAHPVAQYRLADAPRATRFHMAIALVEHQTRGLLFEFR